MNCRGAASTLAAGLLAGLGACAPPASVPTVVREAELPASGLASGADLTVSFDAPGYRLVEVSQEHADVKLRIIVGGKAESFDGPARRAVPERACFYSDRGSIELKISAEQSSADPSARVHVRVSTISSAEGAKLRGVAQAECLEGRAAREPEKWTEQIGRQRAGEFVQAGEAWQALSNDSRAAAAYLKSAWMLRLQTSDFPGSLARGKRARHTYRRAGNDAGVAHATLQIAVPRWDLNQAGLGEDGKPVADKAALLATNDRELKSAVAAFDAAGDRFFSAEARNNLANNYFEQGRLPEAMDSFSDAAARFRDLRETGGATRAMANFIYLLDRNNQYRDASIAFDRLLPGGVPVASDGASADILILSASTHSAAGNYGKALPQFVRALQIHEASADTAGMARSLNGLAATYMRLGLPAATLEYAQQARAVLAMRESYKGPTSENAELASELLAGNAQRALGDLRGAKTAHAAALRYSGNGAMRTQAHLELARDALAAGEPAQARAEIALARKKPENDPTAMQALQLDLESARAAMLAGKFGEAFAGLSGLEGKFAATGAREWELEVLHALAESQFRRGKPSEALTLNQRSLDLLGSLRLAVSSPELRSRVTSLYRDVYQLRVEMLISMRERERDGQKRALMLNEILANSDQAGAGLVQEAAAARTLAGDVPLDSELSVIAANIALREHKLAAIETGVISKAREADLRTEVARLRVQYDALSPVTARAPRFEVSDYGVDAIRGDTAILFFVASSNGLHRFVLTRGRIEELPALSGSGIARRGHELMPPDRLLSDRPHLIIVPDASIAEVLFSTLTGDRDVTLALTLRDAIRLAQMPDEKRRVNLARVALFSDPVFTPYDKRVLRAAPKDSAFPAIERLAGTAEEANDIAAQLTNSVVMKFTGLTATRTNALSASVGEASVLHFATHAIASDQWPYGSGLLLTGFTSTGEPLNGFVSTLDLLSQRSSTDLVVLSACDTARGDAAAGENVAGLARAFLGGGARRVVATRWKVDDTITARLMREFYSQLAAGATPPAALRSAQRKIAAEVPATSAAQWSAFVLYERAPAE